MKKIFYILASAIVALGAVACENEGLENVNPANGEGLTIAANITKVAWEGVTPAWESGDAFEIEGFTFTTTDGANFVCADKDVYSLVGKTNVEVTFGEFDSTKGLAGTVFTTTIDEIKVEGTVAEFAPQNAVLMFTAAEGTEITFASENLFSAAEVTVKATGKTQYVAVKAGVEGTFSYSINGIKCRKRAGFTANAAKFYNLGELYGTSEWGIVGGFTSWANGQDVTMFKTSQDNLFVAYGVEIKEVAGQSNGFKIRQNGTWVDSGNYGTTTVNGDTKNVDTAIGVYTDGGSGNITVNYGTYDIYFDRLNSRVYVMTVGKEYTEATAQTTNTKYSFAGNVSGWNDSVSMNYAGDEIWTVSRTFEANEEWKVKNYGNWNASWGYDAVWPDNSLVSSTTDGNAKTKTAGEYIVGFIASKNKITFVKK